MEINHESTNKLDKKHCKSAVTNKAKIGIPEFISRKINTNAIYVYVINSSQ